MTCLRCGSCCYLGPKKVKCKHLVILKSGTTLCRIYPRRLGTYLGTFDGISYDCVEKEKMDYKCPN